MEVGSEVGREAAGRGEKALRGVGKVGRVVEGEGAGRGVEKWGELNSSGEERSGRG